MQPNKLTFKSPVCLGLLHSLNIVFGDSNHKRSSSESEVSTSKRRRKQTSSSSQHEAVNQADDHHVDYDVNDGIDVTSFGHDMEWDTSEWQCYGQDLDVRPVHDEGDGDVAISDFSSSVYPCENDDFKNRLKNILDSAHGQDSSAVYFPPIDDADFDPRIFLYNSQSDNIPVEVIDEQVRFLKKYPFFKMISCLGCFPQATLDRFEVESQTPSSSDLSCRANSTVNQSGCETNSSTVLYDDASSVQYDHVYEEYDNGIDYDYTEPETVAETCSQLAKNPTRCSMRLSLSPKYLFYNIQSDGKRIQSYGWNKKTSGADIGGESNFNITIRLEDVMEELELHKKRRFDNKAKLFDTHPKMIKAFENKINIQEVAIYLGKLTLTSDPLWEGNVFLYLNTEKKEHRMAAAIHIIQENIKQARRTNNALRKRLRELQSTHQTIYHPAAVLSVHGTDFLFEAVNASLPPNTASHNDEFLFIAFKSNKAVNYNALFGQVTFDVSQVTAHQPQSDKKQKKPDQSGTIVSMDTVLSQRIQKTVEQMEIPECPEIYKVKGNKPNDKSKKRISAADGGAPPKNDDDDDCEATLFPEDPELKLLNLPNKEDLFSKEVRIATLSRAIKQLKAELQTIQDPSTRTLYEGIIAALLYSNLRWRLGSVQGIDPALIKQSTTFDIDQASLDVNFCGQSTFICQRRSSNQQYLKDLCDKIVDKVN